MAGTKRKLEVVIAGDASGLNRSLKDVDGFGSKLRGKLGKVGKAAGLALGGGLVAAGGVAFKALGEAQEAAKIGRLTDAVLKSTGGAANVTAADVDRLSTSISNLTGIDDEAVQEGQNLLLTFTNIRNEVGKGNDVFDQTTRAAVDMSAALGKDVKSSAQMLGKALNDPVAGMGKLSRAGVTFTEQQKEQIKTLQESGDTLGAQRIILDEVGKKFGGAAEAAADPMTKLQTIANNALEEIGTAILPIAEKVATWLGEKIPQAIDWFREKWPGIKKAATPVLRALGTAVAWVADAIGTVVEFVMDNWPKVQDAFEAVTDKVRDLVEKYWPGISEFISAVIARVRTVISVAVAFITAIWDRFGSNIMAFVENAWNTVKRVVEAAINFVRNIIKVVTSLIKGDWSGVWDGIKGVFSASWDAIKAILTGALRAIQTALSAAWKAVTGALKAAWDAIIRVVSGYLDTLVGFWSGVGERIVSALSGIGRAIGGVFSAAWEFISGAVMGLVDSITGAFSGIVDTITGVFSGLGDTIVGALKGAWNALAGWWNRGPGSWSFTLPGWVPVFGGKGFDMPNMPTFEEKHTGGIVGGRGEIPTMLLGGEGVLTEPTVRALAHDLFRRRPATQSAAGGVTVVVNVHGDLVAEQQLERHLADVVTRSMRRGGALSASIRRSAGVA